MEGNNLENLQFKPSRYYESLKQQMEQTTPATEQKTISKPQNQTVKREVTSSNNVNRNNSTINYTYKKPEPKKQSDSNTQSELHNMGFKPSKYYEWLNQQMEQTSTQQKQTPEQKNISKPQNKPINIEDLSKENQPSYTENTDDENFFDDFFSDE